jgi:hypothetical protein
METIKNKFGLLHSISIEKMVPVMLNIQKYVELNIKIIIFMVAL